MQSDQTPWPLSFKRLLSADEGTHQITLREQLTALNTETVAAFTRQPSFEGFVRAQLLQAFPTLPHDVDPRRMFIRALAAPARSTAATLLPNILEAVVQRIVEGQPGDYATRQTGFVQPTPTGQGMQAVATITAAAFDRFLDQLVMELDSRYGAYLHAFWEAPVSLTDIRSRKQWLVHQRTRQVHLETQLLKADGLLSDGAYVLLTKVLRYPDAVARRQSLLGYRPCVYSLALAGEGAAPDLLLHGALVMTARDPDHTMVWPQGEEPAPSVRPLKPDAQVGTVVLFTPTQGLECFASLTLLDQALHRRLKAPAEFSGLLMLIAQNDQTRAVGRHLTAKSQGQFRYGEVNAAAFAESVEAQCTRLRGDVSAQVQAYREGRGARAMADLPASLDRVADLQRTFDFNSIMQARELKRLARTLNGFLSAASPQDQVGWKRAVERYRNALTEVPEWVALPSLQQFSDSATLRAYSNQQLRNALDAEYGLEVNPDHILIATQEPRSPVGVYLPGAPPPVPEGPRYVTRKRTLTELALENVGGLDLNFVNFSTVTDSQGQPYSALSPAQIQDLVRSVNIGERYPDFLKGRLLTSPEALAQKSSYARITALQMSVDVLEAKIAGDFLPDRLDRGFQWVKSVLNHPEDTGARAEVEGHRVLVRSLHIRGVRVRGVMVFSTASEAVGSLVVYMPQAPSGRLFYEFADSAHMVQELIGHRSWHDYLVNRVGLENQVMIRRTLTRGISGSMVYLQRISENALMEAYELEASAAISTAMQRTTSTQETNISTTFNLIEAGLDVLTLVLPVKVTLVIGMARSLFSLVRGIQAAEAGERELAAQSFVRALAELVGAVADGLVGGAPTPAGVKSVGLSSKMALGKKPSGVAPLPGWEQHGIFSQAPAEGGAARHFLNQGGHWYSIKFDADVEIWRLRDARKPFAYHLAPLRRDALGNWEVASPAIGLKGGYPVEQTLANAFPHLTRGGARRVLDAFSFPAVRVLELEFELAREMSVWGHVPTRFRQYLNQPRDIVELWLEGYEVDLSSPLAGPSHAPVLPSVTLPVQPMRQPLWTQWGQVLPASQVVPNPLRAHTVTIPDPVTGVGGDAIAIGHYHYSVLPKGENCPDTLAHLYDPSEPPLNFASLFERLSFDFRRQPRVALYDQAAGVWRVDENPMLYGDVGRLFAGVFPTMAVASRQRLANALFNQLNPGGVVTSGGLNAFLHHLSTWRSALNSGPDPLQFLASSPLDSTGRIRVGVPGSAFLQMGFGYHATASLGQQVSTSMGATVIRDALRHLLTSIGYQLIADGGPGPELLFRWSPQGAVYCLRSYPSMGQRIKHLHPIGAGLNLQALDATTRAIVTESQARGAFVILHGGGLTSPNGYPTIFILKQ